MYGEYAKPKPLASETGLEGAAGAGVGIPADFAAGAGGVKEATRELELSEATTGAAATTGGARAGAATEVEVEEVENVVEELENVVEELEVGMTAAGTGTVGAAFTKL